MVPKTCNQKVKHATPENEKINKSYLLAANRSFALYVSFATQ